MSWADRRFNSDTKRWEDSNLVAGEVKALVVRSLYTCMTYPMDYAAKLMQLGYEPFEPVERPSRIGKSKYLALPNVFEYLKYIKDVDGFTGCYRGLTGRLCQNIVGSYVHGFVARRYPWKTVPVDPRRNPGSSNRKLPIQEFFKKTGWKILCSVTSDIASQPFYVISVRMVGQFVGRENFYNSVLLSIKHIYEKEGIAGFFAGIVPRMLGDVLFVWMSSCLLFLTSNYMRNSTAAGLIANWFANSWTYRFHVVASVMAVNDSGLAIGGPPHTVRYENFWQCLEDLGTRNQLRRGTGIFLRQYVGKTSVKDGKMRPIEYYFGPVHADVHGAKK